MASSNDRSGRGGRLGHRRRDGRSGSGVGLAGIIVGFCEPGALVLGAASWAGERRAGDARREPGGPGAPKKSRAGMVSGAGGSVRRYVVDARRALGVQAGDGNIQRNEFRRSAVSDDASGADE